MIIFVIVKFCRSNDVIQTSIQPIRFRNPLFFHCALIKTLQFLWQNFSDVGGLLQVESN